MRIAIVNDSPLAVEALRRALSQVPKFQIVWIALDGAEAVQKAAFDKPDIILMDILMPVMDGVEATRRIMSETPCAILVVTATVLGHASKVVDALGAGALDAVASPVLRRDDPQDGAQDLLSKIDHIERMLIMHSSRAKGPAGNFAPQLQAAAPTYLIGIGSSSGGPSALAAVLAGLPNNLPAAIVIIQHVDPQFASIMAQWLDDTSTLPVRIALEGDRLVCGNVLVAGTGDHLVLRDGTTLGYKSEPKGYPYRPSIDQFFASMVKHWRGQMAGVLLTGMGRDGALGLKTLRQAGAFTIAQDHATCAVYGMPKAAAELNAAVEILPLDQIAASLEKQVARAKGARR